MSTTIVCCNTRKYHGLMVVPIDQSEREYVLLSSLDETLIVGDQRFNLALHRYRGVYEPRGHKYITDFEYTPTPTITYRVGDVVLRKELLWIHRRSQLMVRYTLLECGAQGLILHLRPFLAYRDRHSLSRANKEADMNAYAVANGVKCSLYSGFPWLNMQLSTDEFEFVNAADWYYDFEYSQELARGYEGHEDLSTPGYFETPLVKGQSVIFSASTESQFGANKIEEDYSAAIARRTNKVDLHSCLQHSARQFIVRKTPGCAEVVAGFPWYSVVGREALIALPGLTLEQGHKEDCIEVLDGIVRDYYDGTLRDSYRIENSIDALLWAFRAFERLEEHVSREYIWDRYSAFMISLLEYYKAGVHLNEQGEVRVELHENGLLWGSSERGPITWMDTTADVENATSRRGYIVEVNALWYNALCYTLELAKQFGAEEVVEQWGDMPKLVKRNFMATFWHSGGRLMDYVDGDRSNGDIRPSMIVACALPYKMLSVEEQISVVRTIDQHLLTPKGLRSLSPNHPKYDHSISISGSTSAVKNGSVWVWPLAMYVRVCFEIMGDEFLYRANDMIREFTEEIQSYGIGSVGEYFDSAPPFTPRGAISQAWSVAAVLEIIELIYEHGHAWHGADKKHKDKKGEKGAKSNDKHSKKRSLFSFGK